MSLSRCPQRILHSLGYNLWSARASRGVRGGHRARHQLIEGLQSKVLGLHCVNNEKHFTVRKPDIDLIILEDNSGIACRVDCVGAGAGGGEKG